MGGSSGQVVGYRYFTNFLLFIGNPIEKLLGINFDKRGWLSPFVDEDGNTLAQGIINSPSLFGENEGGVAGVVHVQYGTENQEVLPFYKDYMESRDLQASAYPFQSYLAFTGLGKVNTGNGWIDGAFGALAGHMNEAFYVGNSGYMKEMLLWPKRTRIRNDGSKQWYEVREDGAVVCEIGGLYEKYVNNESIPFGYIFESSAIVNGVVSASAYDDGYYTPITNDKNTAVDETDGVYTRTAFGNYGGADSIHEADMNITTSPSGIICRLIIDGIAIGNECSFLNNIHILKTLDKDFAKEKIGGDFFETQKYYLDCIAWIREPIHLSCISKGSVKAYSDTIGPLADQMISLVSIKSKIYPGVKSNNTLVSGVDINPIHKIREILTDDTAMAKPETDVNDQNFMKAANRIWDEGLGISWAIDEKSCIDAINELCYHIEAGIRVNRQTGLYEMVLFRDNWFEESEIHTIAESKIKSMQYEITNADEVINQVNVNFYDRVNIKNSSFSISENGLIQTLNRVNAETLDFPYFMNMRNAEIVANWKLKILSTGALKGTFTTGWRTARKWNRYDLIKLPWSKRWVGAILVRIMSINLGGPTNNEVSIDFVEVVPATGMMNTTIVVDDVIDKPLPPQACQYEPFEMPYYLAVMALGQRKADEELAYESNFGLVGTVAEKPQENSLYAVMMTNNGDEWVRAGSIQYSATADLDQIISKTSSSFTVKNWKKISNVPTGTLIKCGRDWLGTPGEWMVLQGIDPYTGIISVKRGALDTPPQGWGIDTKLYFCGKDVSYDQTEYVSGEQVLVSALTTTPSGVLEQRGSIPVEMKARAIRPYPPANVKFNDIYLPETLIVTNNILLTWAHRNRAQQTGGEILGWYDGDVTVESGVTYSYELISENVVLDSQSNINANIATILASSLKPNKPHTLKLWSVRDSYESYQKFEHSFFVEAASLILTATTDGSLVAGNTVPAANINVVVDESLSANMKFDGSSISGKANAGSTITIEIQE